MKPVIVLLRTGSARRGDRKGVQAVSDGRASDKIGGGRALLSWPAALALSAGAWMLAYAFFRIGRAALVTYTGQGIEAPPAFLPPLVLLLSAVLAVGAARVVLHRPLDWASFTDAKDPGPALGATIALAAGLFLAGAIGLLMALRTGVLVLPGTQPNNPTPNADIFIYLGVWLLPALLVKGADYLALRREQGR